MRILQASRNKHYSAGCNMSAEKHITPQVYSYAGCENMMRLTAGLSRERIWSDRQ